MWVRHPRPELALVCAPWEKERVCVLRRESETPILPRLMVSSNDKRQRDHRITAGIVFKMTQYRGLKNVLAARCCCFCCRCVLGRSSLGASLCFVASSDSRPTVGVVGNYKNKRTRTNPHVCGRWKLISMAKSGTETEPLS